MKKTSILILALAIFASCHNSSSEINDKQSTRDLTLVSPQSSTSSGEDKLTETTDKSFNDSVANPSQIILQGSAPNPDWDKKIIKTAFLKLEVKDFNVYTELSHKAAKQYGGYIANEEQTQSEEKIESTISIKVPVEQFESLMNQLPASAEKIVEKRITTEDVTGEVVSRLQAKEQMRLKYLEFLKQAKNMEDVLRVQSEINALQEEIESASGRINYLSHQSAYSTINLTFYQPLAGYIPANNNPGFVTRLFSAFKTGFHFIAEILLGAISIWPLFLIIALGLLLLKRRRLVVTATTQKL